MEALTGALTLSLKKRMGGGGGWSVIKDPSGAAPTGGFVCARIHRTPTSDFSLSQTSSLGSDLLQAVSLPDLI